MRGTVLEMTYGDRVRRARLAQGLTQEQFADEVGVTPTLLGRHETSDEPPTRNRRALAAMIQLRYGIDADWLLTGESVPAQRSVGAQVTRGCVGPAIRQSLWALAA